MDLSCEKQAETDRARANAPISVTDLFTIGIGPSSSHTVGPMRAAFRFAQEVTACHATPCKIRCELFGSLALTGKGHATDHAILAGLSGWEPEKADPQKLPKLIDRISIKRHLLLAGKIDLGFDPARDLLFRRKRKLPFHPNAMRFNATLLDGSSLTRTYYSIGGGSIVEEGSPLPGTDRNIIQAHPFSSGDELLKIGDETGLAIHDIVLANEQAWRETPETEQFLDNVRDAMNACIDSGCSAEGVLPGGLNVKRRARAMHEKLEYGSSSQDPALVLQWVSLWALAVNEENAAGGRVVTAPTNGAAGILPAVLRYYDHFTDSPTLAGSRAFLLTAAAIGFLYKKRASISAAEMGCQGEVGVACSMAAAGLVAALGGSNRQIENAAEIGMEHNLGLTCDPIGGLVQIPCIERNTMGAVKAINAAYLALRGDGQHFVSLDSVIETMRQTGKDMRTKYKETSLGGLAVSVVDC